MQNAPLKKQLAKFVTITHNFHPLYGKKLEMIELRRDKQLGVIVKAEDGKTARIPLEFTDYAEVGSPTVKSDHLLYLAGLIEVAKIINHIKKRKKKKTDR